VTEASNGHDRAGPRRRAAAAWGSLALGIFIGVESAGPPAWWSFALSALLSVGAMAWRGNGSKALLAAACVCLGLGLSVHRMTPRDDALWRLAGSLGPGEPAVVVLEGVVIETPREVSRGEGSLGPLLPDEGRSRFVLLADTLGTSEGPVAVQGRVWCKLPAAYRGVSAGDRARVTGTLTPVHKPLNPGQSRPDRWALQSGFVGSVSSSDALLVERLSGPSGARAWALSVLDRVRSRGREAMESACSRASADGAALLCGLIVGDVSGMGGEVREDFTRLGLAHLLSISGFHISLMAMMALTMLRVAGDQGRVESAALAGVLLAYLCVVPAEAPILRASAMTLALLIAESLGRRYDRVTLLLWISAGLLVVSPLDLWSLGYQLSCGLTLVLLWLGEPFHARMFGRRVLMPGVRRRTGVSAWARRVSRAAVSTAILCWLASVPLVWSSTGLLTPWATLATLVLTPLVVPLMFLGYVGLVLGAAWPGLATVVAWPIAWSASACMAAASAMSALPASAVTPPPLSIPVALAMTALVLWLLLRGRRHRPGAWAALGVLCLLPAADAARLMSLRRDVALRLDTLAVGDGTLHVLRSGPDALLWDAGSLNSGLGVREIPRALRALGVWRVPRVVVSHGDADHLSLLPDLAGPLGVREVLVGERVLERAKTPSSAPARVLEMLRDRGIVITPIARGAVIPLGETRLTTLWPPPGARFDAENDHSLVARVDPSREAAGPAWLLLTGDIQDHAVRTLASMEPALAARVVEAPHHGSARSAAAAWVRHLGPRVVVQSTGPRRLGSPVWAGVRAHAAWHATAADGAIFAEFERDGTLRHGTWLGGSLTLPPGQKPGTHGMPHDVPDPPGQSPGP
jgi:competence protein ComEC